VPVTQRQLASQDSLPPGGVEVGLELGLVEPLDAVARMGQPVDELPVSREKQEP
jgi:hypothetical protein